MDLVVAGTPCTVDIEYDFVTEDLALLNLPVTCGSYDITNSNLAADFTSGVTTITGAITLKVAGFINCNYYTAGTVGTYTNSGGELNFEAGPQYWSTSGGFPCPSSVDFEFQNGTLEIPDALGEGTVGLVVNGTDPCELEFDYRWVTEEVINLEQPFTCTNGMDITSSDMDIDFSGGVSTISWLFQITGPNCTFNTSVLGPVIGTFADSSRYRYFDAGPKNISKTAGSFLCPSVLPDVELQNGRIRL